ncbi:hypothetical protein Goarm_005109 [Gossypium armourianum]|uniref:Pre-mRNA-splicing factor SPF27 n=1 Tax=Gossypium armourianum TaxID=34283 RepID=A0A7J9JYX5_9ROSI|nr:hypothetical protein [Gossypium armourianum]
MAYVDNVLTKAYMEIMEKGYNVFHGKDVYVMVTEVVLRAELCRMQKLAQQQNEKIETVNRERKFHQQNTAYELNALSTQWKELCLKNIEIHAACCHIEKHIAELRREAAERGWNLEANLENGALSPST